MIAKISQHGLRPCQLIRLRLPCCALFVASAGILGSFAAAALMGFKFETEVLRLGVRHLLELHDHVVTVAVREFGLAHQHVAFLLKLRRLQLAGSSRRLPPLPWWDLGFDHRRFNAAASTSIADGPGAAGSHLFPIWAGRHA